MSELTSLLFPTTGPGGADLLALVARRTYRVHGSRLVAAGPADSVEGAWPADDAASTETDRTVLLAMDLLAATKPSTDVLVCGTAHPRTGAVRVLDTGVAAGTLRKYVRVWGERRVELDVRERLRFSEPALLTPTAIVWENAYGGVDASAAPSRADVAVSGLGGTVSYPRNPRGRGFAMEGSRSNLEGSLAPSLEDPEDPVTAARMLARTPLDWIERPVAACYEPVGPLQFPRAAHFLAPDHEPATPRVFEVRKGALKEEDIGRRRALEVPDVRFQSCAPSASAAPACKGTSG